MQPRPSFRSLAIAFSFLLARSCDRSTDFRRLAEQARRWEEQWVAIQAVQWSRTRHLLPTEPFRCSQEPSWPRTSPPWVWLVPVFPFGAVGALVLLGASTGFGHFMASLRAKRKNFRLV
jgi:hypothetical protein